MNSERTTPIVSTRATRVDYPRLRRCRLQEVLGLLHRLYGAHTSQRQQRRNWPGDDNRHCEAGTDRGEHETGGGGRHFQRAHDHPGAKEGTHCWPEADHPIADANQNESFE